MKLHGRAVGQNRYSSLESKEPPTHPVYRSDIDGLRALAVLLVVGFHAFPGTFKGGFIGVDMFFVISGYLISTIIFGGLKHGAFCFAAFYSRRIRRIFPALLLVLIFCFAAGWFVLLTGEYKQLGKHIAAGAGFVSNFILWSERGYFDNDAHTKPLLHLWSLGIEEQYYVIWPVLLRVAWKWNISLVVAAAVVAGASMILNLKGINKGPVATFYLPQTRFWELLTGSILAYVSLNRASFSVKSENTSPVHFSSELTALFFCDRETARGDILSFCGAMLIVTCFSLVTKESAFPGWWAILPVLGTTFVISAGAHTWLNRTVLSNKVLVWFGLISYPLYLWHWPLLSFAEINQSEPLSNGLRIVVVLVSVALAWLTYRFVERPIRFGGYGRAKAGILVCLMVAVGIVGYDCFRREGLGFRLKDRQEYSEYFDNGIPDWKFFKKIEIDKNYRVICDFYDLEEYLKGKVSRTPRASIGRVCYERNHAHDRSVLIWGDSHGAHLYSGLKKNLPTNWQILQVTSSGCSPYVAYEGSATDYCMQSNWFALKTIQETRPDVVVVAQNEFHDAAHMNMLAEKLKGVGVGKIILAGPTPHWVVAIPRTIATKLWINTPHRTFVGIDKNTLEVNQLLRERFHESAPVKYADLIGLFCNNDGCLTHIGSDKRGGVTSWDEGHLTPIASDYLAKNLLAPLITGKVGG